MATKKEKAELVVDLIMTVIQEETARRLNWGEKEVNFNAGVAMGLRLAAETIGIPDERVSQIVNDARAWKGCSYGYDGSYAFDDDCESCDKCHDFASQYANIFLGNGVICVSYDENSSRCLKCEHGGLHICVEKMQKAVAIQIYA